MKKSNYNLINNIGGWLCFVIAAVTYLLTIEPTASFWDCPEFISQGAKLEVGHPPGNPIFMLAARFFVTLFGGVEHAAVAVNSMSALLSAATILLLFWSITHLARKIMVADGSEPSVLQTVIIMAAGLCGSLAYTWSDTFWFSAVEGEVYAFSSFCTALVFWLILKWENRADEPHSDRYLVLIAYVIGVSIAVHLLNLLCIPAIVLVYYYRRHKDADAKGSLMALGVSVVIVAAILYGLVPGFIKVAQGFELVAVNTLGMGYNMGVIIYAVALVAVLVLAVVAINRAKSVASVKWLVFFALVLSGLTFVTDSVWVWVLLIAVVGGGLAFMPKVPVRVFNVMMLSILVIFAGYSSYALLLIRASANTPMNQNAPDNVFALASYLNREQYGQRPLFLGPVYAETLDLVANNDPTNPQYFAAVDENGIPVTKTYDNILRDENGAAVDRGESSYMKVTKTSASEPDKYVKAGWTPDYATAPDLNMLFTRVYSSDHIKGYKDWGLHENSDLANLPYLVPADTRRQWAETGYAPVYQLMSYLPNLQPISTSTDGYVGPENYAWKASFGDNFRYFMNYQLNHMYWRYFMWNFAGRQNDIQGNGEPHLGNWISGIPAIDNMRLGDQSLLPEEFSTGNKGHNVFFMLPLLLGLFGIVWQSLCRHRENPNRGIEQFWVVFFLFFMTGIAIVLYLNQTPGQPRERDYAFAGSFYAFAIWIGLGVPAVARFVVWAWDKAVKKGGEARTKDIVAVAVACVVAVAVPLQMVSQTWDDHDRSGRYTARDFGANYLNSLDENAIIFTNGDNDTFPLWYAQEVEGIRTDVRVVNLSYLSTDWYARQQAHPYYDAAAIDMTATPSDYAYDNLVYSFRSPSGVDNTPVEVIQGLKEFYASEPTTKYTGRPLHLLTRPNMFAKVPADAAKAFAINPQGPDSVLRIPYMADTLDLSRSLGSSFGLSKLLSFDIVANSIAGGFKRPVYFATTVPSSYYLGLEPMLNTTGLALQVTPFVNAGISPTVEKAYENITSRFRWGGLDADDAEGLYLDETVRRMVSTVRNSMIETAEHLINSGEYPASDFAKQWAKDHNLPVPENRYDMARALLNLMEEKLPSKVTRYESLTDMPAIVLYLKLNALTGNADDLAHAEALMAEAMPRYAALSRYAASLNASRLHSLGNSETFALRYVPMLLGFQNHIDLVKRLREVPDGERYIKALADLISIDNGTYVYHWLYLEDMPTAELEKYREQLAGTGWDEVADKAITLSSLHDATGIDRMGRTNDFVREYSVPVSDLKRLNPGI